MNYMKKVADLLGVEINEEFKVRSTKYTQNVNSEIFVFTKVGITTDDGITRNDILRDLLTGAASIIKLPWKPKNGEAYYYIDTDDKVTYETFDSSVVFDLALYKLGKLYRTREEAEAHAEEDKTYWNEIRKELEE